MTDAELDAIEARARGCGPEDACANPALALVAEVRKLRRALESVRTTGERYRFNVDDRLLSSPPQNPGAYYCMTIAEGALK